MQTPETLARPGRTAPKAPVNTGEVTTMKNQNIYALFSSDPAEFNKQALKGKLGITLIQLIRANGWNQATTSEHLKVAQPRISDLMRGKLDRFSIDALMELMFRAGYTFDYEFDFPEGDKAQPRLEMKLKKAML
ncbi:helix-turn-helix domain-containing protein [Xanthomonas nasturtii]|uniref:helix-turn-helix domain-containing protein n=1 Tax=Xanthomonas nasturtii TaxID=1843581 RepID=UPI0020135081|nr:XRE family transcriptional regulator [Xanthomonas nasturtii]MCL1586490.1 helix-turn-helix domain-containing protein [Xanthomonas nasturtii]